MTRLASRLAGPIALLALAAHSPAFATAAPAEPQGRITLICAAAAADDFCRALNDAVIAARPGREVRLAEPGETADARTALTLRFVTERRASDLLSGHLAWTAGDGASGQGPTLALTAMDAPLDPMMLRRFAEHLVHLSDLPL